jgi:hypothetical protein
VLAFCRLLASSCTDVQEHAAAALMNMARDIIYGIPVAIAAAGGIPALVRWGMRLAPAGYILLLAHFR